MVIGLELQAELVVEHFRVTVAIAHDSLRHNGLHLLRNDADIGLVAAVIAEAIEAKAIVEMPEKGDAVFEPYVGPPSAPASTAPASSSDPPASAAASACSDTSTAAAAT
jgi:hypothetical protein